MRVEQWRAGAAEQSRRASVAARARWDAVREARQDEPVRMTRVVEITVRDSHRPRRTLRLESEEGPHGWRRWRVSEDGVRVGTRRLGRSTLARLLAQSLM